MRQLNFDNCVEIFRRRWWLVTVLALAGAGAGYGLAHFLPKRYTSQTLVIVEQLTVPGDYVQPVITQDINERLATMQQQILSRKRLEPVIQQLGLLPEDIKLRSMENLVQRLHEAISVTPISTMTGTEGRQLPGFYIRVVYDDARLAQQICSTITSMFMEENLKLRQQLSEQTTQSLNRQLEDAKTRLDGKDSKLAAFERLHIDSLPDESNENLSILTRLSTQLDAVTRALGRARQNKAYAESLLAQQVEAWQSSQAGQNPETLGQPLAARAQQLSEMRSKYADNDPDNVKAKSDVEALSAQTRVEPPQIQNLRAQIFQIEQTITERTNQQEEIHRQIKLYQAQVEAIPAVEQSAMANGLERRQQGEQFQVLDPANLPDKPSFPNMQLFALGSAGAGLGLGVGFVLLVELLDTSLRSRQNVETVLRLPVLAVIPAIGAPSGKRENKSVLALRINSLD